LYYAIFVIIAIASPLRFSDFAIGCHITPLRPLRHYYAIIGYASAID